MASELVDSIPYFEYKVINELMHSHIEEFGENLRAIVAFGPLVKGNETYDIELLEVIHQWQGPDIMPFSSTNTLPMRGKLLLHFLSAQEFEDLSRRDDQRLIKRLGEGYNIIYEVPAGYARSILMHMFGPDENPAAENYFLEMHSDPRRPLTR